jgi:hypothetical protein
MIKFSFGNDRNANGSGEFRWPARSQEGAARGPAYNPSPGAFTGLPAGTTLCHMMSETEVEGWITSQGWPTNLVNYARAMWREKSCDRGRGMVNGDGTGDGLTITYSLQGEFGLSNEQTRAVERMRPVNSGLSVARTNGPYDRGKWRALDFLPQ